jgi:hypothetical protein
MSTHADSTPTTDRSRKITELMRESAQYVLDNNDGFYTVREVLEAERYLAKTEPLPDAWAGKLPTGVTRVARCACPVTDAAECIAARYGLDIDDDEDSELCGCVCHNDEGEEW